MATYRVQVNGVWVEPTNERWWGLDAFEGRHMIPPSRDLVADNTWGPGTNAIPGPPESAPFKWSFWVEGDGSNDQLELRLADLLKFFKRKRYRRNYDVIWEPHTGPLRHCAARILSLDVEYNADRTAARVDIVWENLGGVWRDATTTISPNNAGFSGGGLTVNTGDDCIYDAHIKLVGPAVNPRFKIGTRWVQYTGSVAQSQELVIQCSPIACTKGGVIDIKNLTWHGSDSRALDIYPGDSISCTATGVNSANGSRWWVEYRNVRF